MEILGWNLPLWALLMCNSSVLYLIYMTWKFRTFKRMGVPGPMPLPIMGNLITTQKMGFRRADIMWTKKYGNIFGTFEGRQPNLLVADQELLSELFVKKFQFFPDRQVVEGVNGGFEEAIVNLKGDHWKNVRSLMSPTFTSGKLKKMTPLINKAGNELVEQMSEQMKKDSVLNMKRFLKRLVSCIWDFRFEMVRSITEEMLYGGFTMDVIASTAFGMDVSSNKNPNDPFVKNASELLNLSLSSPVILIMIFCPFLIEFLGKYTGLSFFPKKADSFFRKTITEQINKRREERTDYIDFLQLMIKAHKDNDDGNESEKKGLTFKEILGNCMIFFFAGYETTSSSLSFMTFEIAKRPEIQERLYQEVKDVLGEEEPDYDNIGKLTYLDLCVNEALRMYPPALRLDRVCVEDAELGHYKIPKGTFISVPVYAIHNDPDLWEDPEEFNPDRFLPEHRKTRAQFQFIPFGYGPRNCIGMRLALLQFKMAFVHVIREFRFSHSEKTKIPDDIDKTELLSPKEIWLKVQHR